MLSDELRIGTEIGTMLLYTHTVETSEPKTFTTSEFWLQLLLTYLILHLGISHRKSRDKRVEFFYFLS